MRGKLTADAEQRGHQRIIPAHAGQTRRPTAIKGSWTDHPRACGANPTWVPRDDSTPGSSPRMRGKRSPTRRSDISTRIIPAHAGQTPIHARPANARPDHPRACGANSSVISMETTVSGSSPRMRGKRPRQRRGRVGRRIIPAHAGQTPLPDPAHRVRTNHPRACGANPAALSALGAHVGLSPRMRGKHSHKHLDRLDVRIIPAHAGQTGG